jgi:hypothetical protein
VYVRLLQVEVCLRRLKACSLDKLSSSPSRRTGVRDGFADVIPVAALAYIWGRAQAILSERMWKQHEELLSRKHHLTHPHPASTPSPSFPIARLWSCATGLNSSFPSEASTRAPPHFGELGAGLSQTWLSDKSHCTSRSRRWYVRLGTLVD